MIDEKQDFEFIKIKSMLYALAKLFLEIQQDLYQKNLDSVKKFREFNNMGFSLKDGGMTRFVDESKNDVEIETLSLLSMVSFHMYQISELIIEFPVIKNDHYYDKTNGMSHFYRVIQSSDQNMQSLVARIKIRKRENVFAEFQIDGVIKESLILN